jgi:hypothetical protein
MSRRGKKRNGQGSPLISVFSAVLLLRATPKFATHESGCALWMALPRLSSLRVVDGTAAVIVDAAVRDDTDGVAFGHG